MVLCNGVEVIIVYFEKCIYLVVGMFMIEVGIMNGLW